MEKKQEYHGWAAAYGKAAGQIREADADAICVRCGAKKKDNSLCIAYFNMEYRILLPAVAFIPPALSRGEQILILHYLSSGLRQDEVPLNTGRKPDSLQPDSGSAYLSYRKLPGGMFYDSAYRKNGPARLLAAFGNKPETLFRAAAALGGSKAAFGDISVRIPVFPKLDAVVVLYRGDDEFPPDINILYNDTITAFLSLEDIAVLAGCLAGRLQAAAKQL